MFRGSVKFETEIRGNGIEFDAFDIDPKRPGVATVTIEGPNGSTVTSEVHLSAVATEQDGFAIAEEINTILMDRLAYHRNIVLEPARQTEGQFFALSQPAQGVTVAKFFGSVTPTGAVGMVAKIGTGPLKAALENTGPPGERNFGLFRSALQSGSSVEAFMHLYNIVLMLYGDKQANVDAFILGEEPTAAQSNHPFLKDKTTGLPIQESIYTRLRNEFAHVRAGVSIEQTKREMCGELDNLRRLAKRAIQLNP